METLNRMERILLMRAFAMSMTAFTFAVLITITTKEVRFAITHFYLVYIGVNDAKTVLEAFSRQNAVGVILVALGVILEERHTIVSRILKTHGLEHWHGQEELSELCELYGFYILVLGLFVECLGELLGFFDTHPTLALPLMSSVSVPLNLLGLGVMGRLMLKLQRIKLS